MIKYYWYITSDPKSDSYDMDEEDIKRSITVPPENLFHITESIDGYKHMITEKNTGASPIMVNDSGKPNEISRIERKIKVRLIEKWNEDHRKYLVSKHKETSDDTESDAVRDLEMLSMMRGRLMYRKKISTRKPINRCKCALPKKRTIRKAKK